jgi:serine/threonine protein kinase
MASTCIQGLSRSEVDAMIKEAYPNRSDIIINSLQHTQSTSEESAITDGESVHTPRGKGDEERMIALLNEELKQKTEEVEALTLAAGKASLSIQSFHNQQAQLFDDFVLLRSRYDEQKSTLHSVLWGKCAPHHPSLKYIPPEMNEKECVESEAQLDKYYVGEVLGEGQFATVHSCRLLTEPADSELLALKMIKKERINTFSSLKRVSNEISILKRMHSKYVVACVDTLHTQKNLYIVTERGGSDLFEFFDEHPGGVPDEWAKEIVACIIEAVSYCHRVGVCHRDLKPENILMDFNQVTGQVVDLKLCDFGLSAHFQPNKALHEFCGSPGFFAPEMIVTSSYYGDKSDWWSVGCIILELILGHESFCEVWMGAYDYDLMQDKVRFNDEVDVTLKALPEVLSERFSKECKDFILKLLQLNGQDRPSDGSLIEHEWLGQIGINRREADAKERPPNESLEIDRASPLTPIILDRSDSADVMCPGTPTTDPNVVRMATLSVETRAREMFNHADDRKGFHLPPIDPPTPSVVSSRKVLQRPDSESLLLKAVNEDMAMCGSSSSGKMEVEKDLDAKPFKKGNRRSRDGIDPNESKESGTTTGQGSVESSARNSGTAAES